MITATGTSFSTVRRTLLAHMERAPLVRTERWQGVDATRPEMTTRELLNVELEVDLAGVEELDHWCRETKANVPWADDHFEERVSGMPLNPGEQWRHWPWGHSADKFRDEDGRFNHSYMERLWPRYARQTKDGRPTGVDRVGHERKYPPAPYDGQPLRGIAWQYGDLQDLVELLVAEPNTRQAWIPLFFPEDTGVGDGGRKPCTLGYHLMVRDDRLSMWYPLRSCDYVRHWPDDCYLAIRLLLWVLDRCRARDDRWRDVVPGTFGMHCTSLHVFVNDWNAIFTK